jgi:dephospho-CoA kinase
MLRIGLTGGIGSGKSTVAQIFEVLGIPVYYADVEARRIMNTDSGLKKSILEKFGEESYKDGTLNRAYMSSIVFNNPSKLDLLNSIVHPATMKDGEAWMQQQTTHYAIHEAALIFEAGVIEKLDYVIGVYAPLPLRLARAMERDNASKEEVLKRMSRQLDEEMKMKRCDFVITNDEEQLVIPQVLSLHEKLFAIVSK